MSLWQMMYLRKLWIEICQRTLGCFLPLTVVPVLSYLKGSCHDNTPQRR